MEIIKYISYAFTGAMGIIILFFTVKIYQNKKEQSIIDKELADLKLKALQKEFQFKNQAFEQTKNICQDIAHQISNRLISNPTWLDRFMDETGATHSGSVFGKRIRHFFYEKKLLAAEAINTIERDMNRDDLRYCFIIDSGTSMYPLFHEIAEKIKDPSKKEIWKNRVYIISNNLPGVQYLMKNGKEDPNNDNSDIAINCFLLPGKPLPAYAAITGDETVEWLKTVHDFLQKKWSCKRENYRILGFTTGNYIAKHRKENEVKAYYPVARGEGHVEIKRQIVNVSDEVFLLSPLMKFSFAGVDLLNKVNDSIIERNDPSARKHPNKVKYEEIEINNKLCHIFTSKRREHDMFYFFSKQLIDELKDVYGDKK